VTRIAAESTQSSARFSGSVNRGWRVALLPTRVGLCVRVPEGRAASQNGVETQRAADTEGQRR